MTQCRVVVREYGRFVDREEAGQLLASELAGIREERAVILGIPRGGVEVAKEVARLLETDLDIVLTHKIGAPGQEEFAIGAVTESGKVFLDSSPDLAAYREYGRQKGAEEFKVLQQRTQGYRKVLPKTALKGRVVVVVDDGVATGFTMQAALWAAKQEHPKRLVAAVPVAAESSLKRLSKYADEIICLRASESFMSVGGFYMNFGQITDSGVLKILKNEAARRYHTA